MSRPPALSGYPAWPRSPHRPTHTLLVLAILAVAASPVSAQTFGQWWWTGEVGIGQRTLDRESGGSAVTEYRDTSLQVSTALNGFLGHPALGRFTAGVDLLGSRTKNGKQIDTNQLGYRLDTQILPRGKYRLDLKGRRTTRDRSGTDASELRGRLADTQMSWGGRFRVARGALRGLILGANEGRTEFIDPDLETARSSLQLLDWGRSGRFSHNLHAERRVSRPGVDDQETEYITAGLNQRGDLSESWRWSQSAVALLRDFRESDGSVLTANDYQLSEVFEGTVRQIDLLSFQARAAQDELTSGEVAKSYGLNTSYKWRPRPGTGVGPFLGYAAQSSGHVDRDTRRVGLTASFSGERGPFDFLVSTRASRDDFRLENSMESRDEASTSASLVGTLRHGDRGGLKKELEIELSRNELRLDRTPGASAPSIILPTTGLDTEDSHRGRLNLSHAWDSRSVGGYAEWSRRSGNVGADVSKPFDTTSITGTAYFSAASYSFNLLHSSSDVKDGGTDDQSVRHTTASAIWRPLRALRLRASYGLTERDVILAPTIDTERTEIVATYELGLFAFELTAFDLREELLGSPEQKTSGITWSVRRRFGGYLPVVTGTQRRGVIR